MMKCLALVLLCASTVLAEVYIGEITSKEHGVGGSLYAEDEHTLIVKKFKYDGKGPDAFFWVGKEGEPSRKGIILPYPTTGKFYDDAKETAVLKGYDGTEDLKVVLPDDLTVSELKWFAVWCRQYSVNFGDLIFTKEVTFDVTEPPKVEEPEVPTLEDDLNRPPLVEPDNSFDHHHEKDPDAAAEPETQSTHKSGAPLGSAVSLANVLIALAVSNYIL